MKNIFKDITILLGSLFLLSLIPAVTFAEENPVLFYGVGCPYCEVVEEQIAEKGIEEEIKIDHLEIYNDSKNLESFREKISECGIPTNRAGVPLLYMDGQCYVGPSLIMSALEAKVSGTEILGDVEQNIVTEETGKKNTTILILVVPLVMVALIFIGIMLQKGKQRVVSLIAFLTLTPIFLHTLSSRVDAMCPVCTAAIGVGLGVSRYLGIDDVIMSIWIGGLVLSAAMAFGTFLAKKTKLKELYAQIISISVMYIFLAVTLYLLNMVGNPVNTLWGIDKIVLGTVVGTLAFKLSAILHMGLKKRNGDKSYFPYQKVVIPVLLLWLASMIFYLILY